MNLWICRVETLCAKISSSCWETTQWKSLALKPIWWLLQPTVGGELTNNKLVSSQYTHWISECDHCNEIKQGSLIGIETVRVWCEYFKKGLLGKFSQLRWFGGRDLNAVRTDAMHASGGRRLKWLQWCRMEQGCRRGEAHSFGALWVVRSLILLGLRWKLLRCLEQRSDFNKDYFGVSKGMYVCLKWMGSGGGKCGNKRISRRPL